MTRSSTGPRPAPSSGRASASGDYVPEAGDLIKVDFSPTQGTEQAGHRRGIVVTPRAYNQRVGRCFVCPTTSQGKNYPFDVPIPPGLAVSGVVLADQGKALDFRARRLVFVQSAPPDLLEDVRIMIGTFLVIP